MQSTARDQYLFTEVKTATPQKRQLLLIESALRLSNRARQYWQQGRNDLAVESLVHAQSMVSEMLGSMDRDAVGDLAKNVSAVYEFIYRRLVQAGHRRDEDSLSDAIRILEIERETWRKVCAKLASEAGESSVPAGEAISPPHFGIAAGWPQSGGFSIEA